MVGRARFPLSGRSVRLRSFAAEAQYNDKIATYFIPAKQIRYENSVEYVEIELESEKAKLGILREPPQKE